jgi:hypothetical protein
MGRGSRLPKSSSSKRRLESLGKMGILCLAEQAKRHQKASLLMGDLAWPRGRGFSLAWRARNALTPLGRRLPGRRLLKGDLRNDSQSRRRALFNFRVFWCV